MPRRSTTKTRHNPEDITTIRGYPDALKLFRMPASRYWYVRMYMRGRGLVKKSTQCEKLADAKHFAITWYEDLLLEKRGYQAIGAESFSVFASKLQDTQARQIKRGELSEDMLDADKMRLDKDLLPHFAGTHISKIDYNAVDAFLDELKDERNLSQSTLKKYVVTIRKVLKEAERDGAINYIPTLPTVKRNDTPRPWFSPKEYQMVLDACRELRDNPPPKYQFDFGELYDFIIFMIHTFLRPSEWKMLQNKHIRFLEQDGIEQLVISVPNTKTVRSGGALDSTSTEVAADVYRKKILIRHDNVDDFLFLNEIKDREYAQDRMSSMFSFVVGRANLETDKYGQKHTTYSLRHSALCYQILKTRGKELFELAKNARTSVLMLEKFYLSDLTPQMPQFVTQLRTRKVLEPTIDG
ncbi:MAG: phage integrase SAM-like domain-containing protein [Alphaproteobacteria bacterium]